MRWTEKTVHVEKKVAHGNPRVSHDMVCSIDDVSMGSRLVTLINDISGILTSLYSALFTALEKKTGHYMANNGFMNKSRLLAPEDV